MLIPVYGLIGQTNLDVYIDRVNDSRSEISDAEVDSLIASSNASGDFVSAAEMAHRYAVKKWVTGYPEKAIAYALSEVKTLEDKQAIDTTYTKAIYNLGRFYFYTSALQEALDCFEKIISLDNIPLRTAQAYVEIGNCYNDLGDPYKSIDYFEKGLTLLEDLQQYESITTHLILLAQVYRRIGSSESLDKHFKSLKRADSLSQFFAMNEQNRRFLINELGNQYISKRYYDFNKADHYYRLNLKTSLSTYDSANVAVAYNNLANLHNLEKTDSADYFVNLGLKYPTNKDTEARLYDNKSQYHLHRQEYSKALHFIHRAMTINMGLGSEISDVPDRLQLNNAIDKTHALYCLKKKVEILIKMFEQDGQQAHLSNALRNIGVADQLIQSVQSSSLETETKLFWRKQASEVYLQGVATSNLLKMQDSVFYFMEKNKAFLLSEEIARNRAYTSLPQSISEKESALNREILKLESALSRTKPGTDQREFQDRLFNAKERYADYYDSITHAYPGHFEGRLNLVPFGLTEARKTLGEDDLLLSYIWNKVDEEEELILGLITDAKNTFSFVLNDHRAIEVLISEYQDMISRPFQTKEDQTLFSRVAFKLYTALFPTGEIRAMLRGKNLYIIPDGRLQKIPFEALIISDTTPQYLLESTNVSYLYSKSFEEYNQSVERQTRHSLLGYAPVQFSDSSLVRLENTGDEIEAVHKIIGGTTKKGAFASRQHFLEKSGDYKIIHLATHANAQGDPWIAFADEKLELRELYTYKNNAELVTLSACNTLLGKVAQGEGVISLSRGFFYSGAKSVVASLWNVNDQSTSIIMTDFYGNLKSGQSKTEALNSAKRAYLESHSLSERSPYYWSSFVLIGDPGPIQLSNNYRLYILGLLAVVVLLYIRWRKNKEMQGNR